MAVSGNIHDKTVQGPGQPEVAEAVPAHCRRVGLDGPYRSLQHRALCDSVTTPLTHEQEQVRHSCLQEQGGMHQGQAFQLGFCISATLECGQSVMQCVSSNPAGHSTVAPGHTGSPGAPTARSVGDRWPQLCCPCGPCFSPWEGGLPVLSAEVTAPCRNASSAISNNMC